jgi:hypothetical protein
MAKKKTLSRPLVSFELDADIEVVALAQLGMSNRMIEAETGFTSNQIMYRLSKAKKGEGYQPGHTYRSEWKNGTSFAARQTINSLGAILKEDARKRLPKLFERPTARVKETK